MESDWCTFGVREWGRALRACSHAANGREFGGIPVCHIHERKLEEAAVRMLSETSTQIAFLARLHWDDPMVRDYALTQLRDVDPRGYGGMIRQRARQKTRATEESSVVYYVRRAGYIKIGYTTNLAKRLPALARGGDVRPQSVGIGPVELLHHHIGGPTAEGQLHRRFQHLRVEGEWFRESPDLLVHIKRLKARQATRAA